MANFYDRNTKEKLQKKRLVFDEVSDDNYRLYSSVVCLSVLIRSPATSFKVKTQTVNIYVSVVYYKKFDFQQKIVIKSFQLLTTND